jgi:DUF4097 and DUF4098 domain-containing protein YvlB
MFSAREDFRLTEPWQDYDHVVVRTLNGRVELSSVAGSGDVSVTGTKKAGGATLEEAESNLADVQIHAHRDETNTRTLVVELDYPEELRHKNIGASLIVCVPHPVTVDVATGNGSVRATNLKDAKLHTSNGRITAVDIAGRLSARTSNGPIEADRVAGDAELETSNGRVVARTVHGRTKIDTSNGGVEVRDAHGDVECETSNGGIVVDARPAVEGRVSLVSSNGSIRATLPQEMKGTIDLSTSNGGLTTNLGNATLSRAQWSKRRLAAELNGGGGGHVLVRTSNGSVAVECR